MTRVITKGGEVRGSPSAGAEACQLSLHGRVERPQRGFGVGAQSEEVLVSADGARTITELGRQATFFTERCSDERLPADEIRSAAQCSERAGAITAALEQTRVRNRRVLGVHVYVKFNGATAIGFCERCQRRS